MTSVAAPDRFDISRVINRLFGVVGRNFVTFLLLAGLLVGVPAGLLGMTSLAIPTGTAGATSPFIGAALLVGIVAFVVTVSANALLQGAVIHGAVSDLAGRPASFGESLSIGLGNILPLIGVGIVSSIGVGAATLLLIVPGVILALAWSVGAPAAVVEQTGVFGSLERSLVLTRNHRGAIFLLALIYVVVSIVIEFAAGVVSLSTLPLGVASPTGVAIQSVVTAVAQTVTAMFSSAGVASIYYELRQIKDGVGAQQLAAVFD